MSESVQRVSPLSQSTDSYGRTDVRTDGEGCYLPVEISPVRYAQERKTLNDAGWQRNAPCVGDWRATNPDPDSARAVIAQHCGTCTVAVECAAWAETEHGYEGVAGGQWWVNGSPHRLPYRRPAEWGTSPEEMRWAHARYARGERDPETLRLERAYQAARKRTRRKSA